MLFDNVNGDAVEFVTVNKGCFVPIEVVTVVEKFLSSQSASASSFNVFRVAGAEATKAAIC